MVSAAQKSRDIPMRWSMCQSQRPAPPELWIGPAAAVRSQAMHLSGHHRAGMARTLSDNRRRIRERMGRIAIPRDGAAAGRNRSRLGPGRSAGPEVRWSLGHRTQSSRRALICAGADGELWGEWATTLPGAAGGANTSARRTARAAIAKTVDVHGAGKQRIRFAPIPPPPLPGRCNAWMPRARVCRNRPEGHNGPHRPSGRPPDRGVFSSHGASAYQRIQRPITGRDNS